MSDRLAAVMDVSLDAGVKAKMKTILHMYDEEGKRKTAALDIPLDLASDAASSNPDVLACGDISAHWVVNIGLNSSDTAAGKLGFSASFNILNEANAPLFNGGRMHIENMQFVPQCTRKDRILIESADPLLVSKRITLAKYSFSVHIGETKTIEVTGMPDGYHEDELVFSSATFRTFVISRYVSPCSSRCYVVFWIPFIFVVNVSAVITLHSFHVVTSL